MRYWQRISGLAALGLLAGNLALATVHAQRDHAGVRPFQRVEDQTLKPELCQTLISQLDAYQSQFSRTDDQILTNLRQLAVNLYQMHKDYEAWEGKGSIKVPIGAFDRVRALADQVYGQSEQLYDASSNYDQSLSGVISKLPSCLKNASSNNGSELVQALSDYNKTARENEADVAGFMQGTGDIIDGWHEKWGPFEGNAKDFAPGFFAPIQSNADEVKEAVSLSENLLSYDAKKFNLILQDLKQLVNRQVTRLTY